MALEIGRSFHDAITKGRANFFISKYLVSARYRALLCSKPIIVATLFLTSIELTLTSVIAKYNSSFSPFSCLASRTTLPRWSFRAQNDCSHLLFHSNFFPPFNIWKKGERLSNRDTNLLKAATLSIRLCIFFGLDRDIIFMRA